MPDELREFLEKHSVEASAPCRIDMGGTLDINTFHFPLRGLRPCTVNIALELRTRVRLTPYEKGRVNVVSKGFESRAHPLDQAPFDQPMGLIFAIASYFRADGVRIDIDSASPPRSALGGSSSAVVALVYAFSLAHERMGGPRRLTGKETALLAQALEASVAGVPCGLQDQLAAVYGGVNAWLWPGDIRSAPFKRKTLVRKKDLKAFARHILAAYCGVPHESRDVNGKWVRQFTSGRRREVWAEIVHCTNAFARAVSNRDYKAAGELMNRETALRREMTPEVLDGTGEKLTDAAAKTGCGARFTGAGGGGCVWALGPSDAIALLKPRWADILSEREDARLLDATIDSQGLKPFNRQEEER